MVLRYPIPDRSNFTPNFSKTPENDVLDIGWAEGFLSDGRPYRLECWAQDQVTMVTIFVSRMGLEDLGTEAVQELLEREDLAHFRSSRRYASTRSFRDGSGQDLLSINVVIGDDEETFVSGGPPLRPYPKVAA